jgi:hypothetical protein
MGRDDGAYFWRLGLTVIHRAVTLPSLLDDLGRFARELTEAAARGH